MFIYLGDQKPKKKKKSALKKTKWLKNGKGGDGNAIL